MMDGRNEISLALLFWGRGPAPVGFLPYPPDDVIHKQQDELARNRQKKRDQVSKRITKPQNIPRYRDGGEGTSTPDGLRPHLFPHSRR
jgi:hypothetical protein